MKKDVKLVLFSLFIIAILVVGGCKPVDYDLKPTPTPTTKPDPTPTQTPDPTPTQTPEVLDVGQYKTDEETIYELIGDDLETRESYLTEDFPLIKEIKALAEEYNKLDFGFDYETMNGDELYNLYTKEKADELREEGKSKKNKDWYEGYRLKEKYIETKYQSIYFHPSLKQAIMKVSAITELISGTDEYLNKYNEAIGSRYENICTIHLIVEEGEWKIYNSVMHDRRIVQ